jgi:ERCC4-type nuclease
MKYVFKDRSNRLPPAKLSGAGAVLGKAEPKDVLQIRIAGNEQVPLCFNSDYVKTERGVIHTFDYCLENDQDSFAIEWKQKDDFISSLALQKKWIHELDKIKRAKEWGLPIIYVVGMTFEDVAKYDYSIFTSGNVTSQFLYRQIATLIFNYNVHVVFAGSREGGAYAVALLLKRRKESLRMNSKRQAE